MSLALSAWLCLAAHAAEFPENRRVLVVYGNPDIGPWEQNFNQITLTELSTNSGIPAIPEFLSLIETPLLQQQYMAESLRLKYSQLQIDLVIAVLPEANSFVHRWAGIFAPQAAILYVLPGLDVTEMVSPSAQSAILQSAVEIATRKTVELIPQVLPDLEHLFVIGGSSDGDLSYQRRAENALAESTIDYEFTVLTGLTPDELLAELARAPSNSAVLLNPYDRDHTGQPLRTMAINTLLDENVPLPVFGAFDTLLQSGTLGGNMTASTLYASSAADIARDMLSGSIEEYVVFSETSYMFDGSKLNQFAIDRSRLPMDSLIVNDPPNFWRDYSGLVFSGIVIMVLQLALIALLMETMRRRNAAESELKKAQKLEALGSLSGGVAHDFNNILMSIMANAELADMKPDDTNNVKTRIRNILSASVRAKDLIAQILMFSRQSASFELKPLHLNSLLEETAEHLRSFLPSGCLLQLDLEEQLPVVDGDPSQIHQMLMNLCVNAQHAMNDAGTIRIASSMRRLTRAQQMMRRKIPAGDYVVVEIADSGPGIDKDALQQIFEPFFTTKPRGKGTGLGLALVYQIAKAHNAFIDLQTSKTSGTCFSLYFPSSADNIIAEQSYEEGELNRGEGEHILLVDDDEMVLDATSQALHSIGYAVTPFASSVAALAWCREEPRQIDLVFSDLSMPEMDGIRMVSSIRETYPQLPAVICTGYLESINQSAFKNISVLHKPTDLKQVSTALRLLLMKQRRNRAG